MMCSSANTNLREFAYCVCKVVRQEENIAILLSITPCFMLNPPNLSRVGQQILYSPASCRRAKRVLGLTFL